MSDFRMKVFNVVARRKNFTRAAEELSITQPAVSKHIREIESFYKTKLFERNGSRVMLTQAGDVLFNHSEELLKIYRNIEFDIAALSKKVKGTLRIGASTTVANYFLPRHLATFKEKHSEVKISLTVKNTELIEDLLSEGKIDVGIVEGQSKRAHLKYTSVVNDEIVLCTKNNNTLSKKSTLTIDDLRQLPMVVRERGSGSLEVIVLALKKAGLNFSQLKLEMELESTESIKRYLMNSNTFAFLSIHSIINELKTGDLKVIDVNGLDIERSFFFITQQGNVSRLHETFYKHLQQK